tara:strand:+ start:285 stop:527 length:243 start_codon:yes stop_codon:yes gene_type:complete
MENNWPMVENTLMSKASYISSLATATASALTFTEIISALGLLASLLVAIFTAWSNHKKNVAAIELSKARLRKNATQEYDA